MFVHTSDELSRLLRFLRSPVRRIPMIVVSQNTEKTAPVLTGERLQRMLGQNGVVRTLSGTGLTHFNRAMQLHPIRPRGVRFYEPKYEPYDSVTKHPFWSEDIVLQVGEKTLNEIIYERCKTIAKQSQSALLPIEEPTVTPIERPCRPILRAKRTETLEIPEE